PVAAAVTSMSIALHTAPTVLYTPSLHDALPICLCAPARGGVLEPDPAGGLSEADRRAGTAGGGAERFRPGLYPPSAGGLPEPAGRQEPGRGGGSAAAGRDPGAGAREEGGPALGADLLRLVRRVQLGGARAGRGARQDLSGRGLRRLPLRPDGARAGPA